MASFRADFDEGKASSGDVQWQERNLKMARASYDRRMQLLGEYLDESQRARTNLLGEDLK